MENNYSGFFSGKGKTGAVVLVTVLSLFLLAKTIGEVKEFKYIGTNPSERNTITVSGKGEEIVKPDITTFSFGITEESRVVSGAQAKVAEKENAILAFLKKEGVKESDMKTTGYNIYPRYEYLKSTVYPYPPTGKQTLSAYVVSETVSVKLREGTDVGKIIGGVGELGATDLSNLSFEVDKYDEVQKLARAKAIKEAKTEAEKLSKDLGVKLVRIVSYSENGSAPYYRKEMVLQASYVGEANAANSVLPQGENKIVSNVTITYEIK